MKRGIVKFPIEKKCTISVFCVILPAKRPYMATKGQLHPYPIEEVPAACKEEFDNKL
jgi:hypothetical protein